MEPVKTSKADAAWLKDLQKRSWEPEVLISGISLAFIFAFPSQLYDLAARMVQDHAVAYLGALIALLYLSVVVNVFKIFFIGHLILRLAWAGLLGLSYAFPNGVIKENLFKTGQKFDYAHPTDMVLRLERICSMAFAFPISVGIIILAISAYLGFLLLIYRLFDLGFFTVYLIFILSVFGMAGYGMFAKSSSFTKSISTSIYASIQATYQSNLGRWTTTGYIVFILTLSIPFVVSDMAGFTQYYNQANLTDGAWAWPEKELIYEDQTPDGNRFPRLRLPSEMVNGQMLPIQLAVYSEDDLRINDIKTTFSVTLDTLGWHPVEHPTDLVRVYLNDSLMTASAWINVRVAGSGQRVYQTLIDMSWLEPGYHDIRVEKLVIREELFGAGGDIRHRKEWARAPFIKH